MNRPSWDLRSNIGPLEEKLVSLSSESSLQTPCVCAHVCICSCKQLCVFVSMFRFTCAVVCVNQKTTSAAIIHVCVCVCVYAQRKRHVHAGEGCKCAPVLSRRSEGTFSHSFPHCLVHGLFVVCFCKVADPQVSREFPVSTSLFLTIGALKLQAYPTVSSFI